MRVAVDTGGTFTDCVSIADGQLKVLKVFSTPSDPSQAMLDALAQIGPGIAMDVRHGTTIGTNAMLERKGARVAFVTTAGFEDTIAIGRQTRSKLYDWFAPLPVCLVPRELRFGVPERVSANGEILRSPTGEDLAALVDAVRISAAEAVAISLLFSFANPETELRVEAALRCLGIPISTSHRILPEFREYERASTIVVNAYLAPRMQSYLLHLEQCVATQHAGGSVDVMQSSGGIISARLAAQEPVRTVLSGPAGGVIGACQVARWAGFDRIVGFDMGGTSTDVFLANASADGAQLTSESLVAGVPVSVPMWTFIPLGPAADRLPASMLAACCAWDQSRQDRSRGQSVLVAEPCRRSPMPTYCWDGWTRRASSAEACGWTTSAPSKSCANRREHSRQLRSSQPASSVSWRRRWRRLST